MTTLTYLFVRSVIIIFPKISVFGYIVNRPLLDFISPMTLHFDNPELKTMEQTVG